MCIKKMKLGAKILFIINFCEMRAEKNHSPFPLQIHSEIHLIANFICT